MAKYVKPVIFRLGDQQYGVDINIVNAIENYQPIVIVPNAVPYIKGIINLRNEVIPVYNLRLKFNMPEYTGDNSTRSMIVIRVEDIMIALEVDAVAEIREFAPSEIVDMPAIVMNDETRFLERVVNCNGNLVVLMDVAKILTPEELAKVKKMKEDMK